MRKLSAIETKAIKGGGDTQSTGEDNQGTGGDTHGVGGETTQGNRSTCMAMVQHRHSNSSIFIKVANCGSAAKGGSILLSCSC